MRRLATRDWVIGLLITGILVLVASPFLEALARNDGQDFSEPTVGAVASQQLVSLVGLVGSGLVTAGVVLAVMMRFTPQLFGPGTSSHPEVVSPVTPDADWDESVSAASPEEGRRAFR